MSTQPEEQNKAETEQKKSSKPKSNKKSEKEAQLISELEKQKDNYLRLCAEYDNFRKRSAKEKADTFAFATAKAVEELLPVIDNFERAVSAQTDGADPGFSMIYAQFKEYLDKLGVKEIQAEGEKFDPNIHVAVMHIEDENFDENMVVQVLQKGYLLGDRVLRAACVKVAN